ncbi:MAG: TetR/AcrR family transcriptional regulator [Myxococcales bacterium]|nr:TetR/AcrR family transcriptional regulator [Myxococcales bacterium]
MVHARAVPRRKPSAPEPHLSATDWEVAALAAVAEHGLAGIAVEPLARRLGVTKGSFYWHFADRDALLRAALARWEQDYTDRVIAAVAEVATPRARLRQLIGSVVAGGRGDRIHLALASSELPVVRDTVARVTRRRLDYLASCYVELGQARRLARESALLAYTAYVGLVHLRLEAPDALPTAAAFAAYVDQLMTRLVP